MTLNRPSGPRTLERRATRHAGDAPPRHPPLEVLLADDDALAARPLDRALREAGLRVRAFSAGRSALAQALVEPPDLAILSLELPDITGFEASRFLRDDSRTQQLPIIMLAPDDGGRSGAAAYAAGADSVLTRPVDHDELLAVVFSLGARRGQPFVEPDSASVAALLVALELHGSDARAHGLRVARLARQAGRELGLRRSALHTLTLAAELHDVGVLVASDAWQPGDDVHAGTHARHAELGARVLAPLDSLDDVSRVVRHHHERWDGRGLPDELAGEEIPALSRLLAVLDRFDSLCHGRRGRAQRPSAALERLTDEARAGRFDPAVVAAFRQVLDRGRVDPERGDWAL